MTIASGSGQDLRGLAARLEIVLLPLRHFLGQAHLHGRHFVFGTAGGPIFKFGGDDVRAGESMMERGVDHAWLHAFGDARVQSGLAGAADERHAIAFANAAILRVERMNFQHVFGMPHVVLVRAVCAPTLYCVRMRPVVRISGNLPVVRSSVGINWVIMKLPLPRTNPPMCITGVPSGALSLQGHWMLPSSSILSKLTPVKVGVSRAISSMISDGWLYCIG